MATQCLGSARDSRAGFGVSPKQSFLKFAVALLLVTSRVAFAEIRPNDCARAAQYSESRRGTALLVMQNGKTIFEHYANGGAVGKRWPIFSGTKSFWGVAAAIAVHDGLFKLDDRVADTITEWKNDPARSTITIRQLLSLTSGLDGASWLHRDSVRDRNAEALRIPLVAPPGSAFTYGPSHLQIFGELLRRKLNGRSESNYLEQKLADRLALSSLDFKKDARGNPLLASGLKLTAREWARFGEMILGSGSVLPNESLQQCFRGSSANPAYGLTFWLNREAANPSAREVDIENVLAKKWQRADWSHVCICRAAPADMVVALGSGYQRLFIIPSMNALIVRQGANAKFSDAHFLRLVLGL